MKKLFGWFTLLIIGWSLGWFSHQHWNTETDMSASIYQVIQQQSTLLNETYSSKNTNKDELTHRNSLDKISQLLEGGDFLGAFEHFETLQGSASDVIVQQARGIIFSRARRFINTTQYRLAEQLLTLYLKNTFRDVDAHLLLAEIHLIENNFQLAINKLYEAKGYAYRTEMIDQIQKRIRSVVDNRTNFLQQTNNRIGLLELYQLLTQLEPAYAAYFLRLAVAQLALKDTNGARRSLHLVIQDPDIGAEAQALLDKVLLAEPQKIERAAQVNTVDIPLLRYGDHFLVDAVFNDAQKVRLLIDTGASMTIITPDILTLNNISYLDTGKTRLFNTVNGQVRAPIYEIESLALGEWQVGQIEVGVMQIGAETTFNGLLGMNFLKYFQFFIDQNEANLRLQGVIEK